MTATSTTTVRRALLLSFAATLSWRHEGIAVESFTLPLQRPARPGNKKDLSSSNRIGSCGAADTSTSTQQWLSPQSSSTDGSLSSSSSYPRRTRAKRPSSTKNLATTTAEPSDAPSAVQWDDDEDDDDMTVPTTEFPVRKLKPDKFSATSMLNHDILTKAQEQELGRAVQRALQVQETLIQQQYNNHDPPQQQHQQQQQQKNSRRGRPLGVKNKKKKLTEDDNNNNNNNKGDNEEELRSTLSIYGGRGMDLEYLEAPYEEERWQQQNMRLIQTTDTAALNRRRNGKRDVVWNMDAAMSTLYDMNNKVFKKVFGDTMKRNDIENILIQGAMARDTLIRSNIRLVMEFARRWLHNTQQKYLTSFEEAMQEGILGLAIAVERYDPERNLKFSTYATPWIINTVRRFVHQESVPYRLPGNYYNTKRRYKLLLKYYHDAGLPVPPLPDLARELGLRPDRLRKILDLTRPALSMDAPTYVTPLTSGGKAGGETDDGALLGLNLVDPLQNSAEHDIDLSLLRQSLENAMASELVPHERDIIRLRLGLDDGVSRTITQVIQAFHGSGNKSSKKTLSDSQVRLMEKQAYQKLRSPQSLSNYKLLAYLDFCGIDNQEEEEATVAKTTTMRKRK